MDAGRSFSATKAIDITGKTYGQLTALRPTGEHNRSKNLIWEFRCSCGNLRKADGYNVRKGTYTACYACSYFDHGSMDKETEGIYIRIACQNQNDSAWFSARCGIVTASRLADAMKRLSRASGDKKKGDYAAAHDDYVRELAREMLTGIPAWHHVTTEMQYGIDKQPEALEAYAKETGQKLTATGLVLHPTIDYLGASPDSIIAPNGGVEAKVPLLSTHMDNLFNDEIPEEYLPQVYCNMLCAEADWWDFFSFCPKDIHDDERLCLPDHLRLFIKRAERSKAKLEIAGEVLEGEAVFRRIEEDAKNTMTEAVELVQKLSQSRHLRLQKPAVEMPKEMLLSATPDKLAGEEPIF